MNDSRPTEAGREEAPGRRLSKRNPRDRRPPVDDGGLRWELRGRLQAVLQELDERPVDWDVIETLLSGAVESIRTAT
jgi:hypothetical protein